MTHTLIELSEDEFDAQYPLKTNHLNPNASWAFDDGPGCLFETYGPEHEFVRSQDPSTIWTLADGDDGDQYVISGYHLVNRIGYLISTVPVPDGINIQVRIPAEPGDIEPSIDQLDQLLSAIAREHFRIETLDTRRSDSLDFHDVAVWSIKDALAAAYHAALQLASKPTVTISIRGGLVEDMNATMPVTVVIDNWDVPDDSSGTRPSRTIHVIGKTASTP